MKMQKPDSVKCGNCTFYANGMCKRYPPQFVTEYINLNLTHNGGSLSGTASSNPNSKWPYLADYDFCGEFLPKDNLTAVEWVAWKKGLLEDVRAANL